MPDIADAFRLFSFGLITIMQRAEIAPAMRAASTPPSQLKTCFNAESNSLSVG
jgi:hypothetical protein